MEAYIREKDGVRELTIKLAPGTRLVLGDKEISDGAPGTALVTTIEGGRVTGQWLRRPSKTPGWGEWDMYCTRCGEMIAAVSGEDAEDIRHLYKFCYNCGADMRGGAGHEDT